MSVTSRRALSVTAVVSLVISVGVGGILGYMDSRLATTCLALLCLASGAVTVVCCGVLLRSAMVPWFRWLAGHCPICGYDLRATPERCPECGTETAAADRVDTPAGRR